MGGGQEGYFGWLTLVDNVSGLVREPWDGVLRKNIYEFFNLVSYLRYKTDKERKMIEKWKKTH